MLLQNIVPLEHECELLASQEAMRQLGIPYHLVGVERLVGIATLAIHVQVGAEVAAPREGYLS